MIQSIQSKCWCSMMNHFCGDSTALSSECRSTVITPEGFCLILIYRDRSFSRFILAYHSLSSIIDRPLLWCGFVNGFYIFIVLFTLESFVIGLAFEHITIVSHCHRLCRYCLCSWWSIVITTAEIGSWFIATLLLNRLHLNISRQSINTA